MARREHAAGVHFLHIGKTGGTSLKKLVKQHNITRTGDNRRLIMHSHSTTLPDVLSQNLRNTAAFFLRDPLARYVSGFNSRLREGAPIAHIPWKPEEKVAFGHFPTANDLAEALSARRAIVQDRAYTAMQAMIHTRMHYTDWLQGPEYLESRSSRIRFIGFQETYEEDVARFFRVLGLPTDVEIPHYHLAPDTNNKTLSELAMRNLREWYAADLVIYDWAWTNRQRWSSQPPAGTAALGAEDLGAEDLGAEDVAEDGEDGGNGDPADDADGFDDESDDPDDIVAEGEGETAGEDDDDLEPAPTAAPARAG